MDTSNHSKQVWLKISEFIRSHRNTIATDLFDKLGPIIICIVVWQWASGSLVNPRILPSFTDTVSEIIALGMSPEVHLYASHTFFRGGAAAVIAFSIAIPVGFGMVKSQRVRRNMEPIISLTYPSPKSPLIPLVIFWLGIGHLSRIFLGVISGLLPMVIGSYNGARNVSNELIWSARAMGVSRRKEVYKIMLPAALPMVLTGVRIGIIFSFVTVISSEMIMARTGLGLLIMEYGEFGMYDRVFAAAFWIAVMVGSIDRLFLMVSRYLVRWSEEDIGGI